ncbi:MAG TPA: proline--tRNA ligase [Oligoflexia bacterium]|nr:proline--tRNA ligase [Oligoflexia bacterium]HMP49706.1 proline--tRNA ligase [Oligoflexia bacterium]
MSTQTAITPTRSLDYPEWYQQVVKASEMAEVSPVRGCMVIRPWGYGMWENIQLNLDRMIKDTGHENAYFPLLIPLSFLEKEAGHVEGFAKECAVVTHHRLEERDGKLIPAGELEEPLIIRPTSETIIGEMFSRWIKSYRDLPLLMNQWANVLRWEMRTRLFLRTAEFLWQEGHTAHADKEDALREVDIARQMYLDLIENYLAIPVITGEKPEAERFPGAEVTKTLEAMMQDRKALQAGTSHYLGQNFARAQNIRFLNRAGELEYAHTTSWGVSTRLIGGLIMTHGDDNGMRVPPRISPKHVVILPVVPKAELEGEVFEYAESIASELRHCTYDGAPVRVHIDRRDLKGGEKNWQWIKKGVPLRIEVGPRDIEKKSCVVYRRDAEVKDKIFIERDALAKVVPTFLDDIQKSYFSSAKQNLNENTVTDIKSLSDFRDFFTPQNSDKPEIHGGFVRAPWCGNDKLTRSILDELKVSIRCIPDDQSLGSGPCVLTGKEAVCEVVFAKSY